MAFTTQTLLLVMVVICTFTATISAATNKCKSIKFSSNRAFDKCQDLPTLSASIHWTYTSSSRNLSIAFVAPPATPAGWVAWAINPTGTGMVGAQALLAFKQTNGSMVVKTYNITAHGPIKESQIAFETSGLAAEEVNGVIQLFGTVKLNETSTILNQVWQAGPSVTGGVPNGHAFAKENLESFGPLNLLKEVVIAAPAPAPAPETISPAGPSGAGSLESLKFWSVLFVCFVWLGVV